MYIRKITSGVLILTMVVFASGSLFIRNASAAALTSMSDTLTRQKAATLSNHTILVTSPTGVGSGSTIILTFDNSTSIPGAWDFEDADVSHDSTPDGVCDTGDTHVVLAASPSGATAGIVDTSSTVITFTNGTTVLAAGSELCFEFGTNAEDVVTGVEQITNGSAGTTKLVFTGTFGDTGTLAMPIISTADDAVVVTATVAPTITFSNTDATTEFGTLTTANAVYADDSGGSASDTTAHTLAVATNAPGGYALTYSGATLTGTPSGTITPLTAGITDDANGTPATSQFGISGALTGSGTMAAGYDNAGTADWKFIASTTTTLASHSSATSDSIAMHYLANIAATTPAGSYTTTITYIATGTF